MKRAVLRKKAQKKIIAASIIKNTIFEKAWEKVTRNKITTINKYLKSKALQIGKK